MVKWSHEAVNTPSVGKTTQIRLVTMEIYNVLSFLKIFWNNILTILLIAKFTLTHIFQHIVQSLLG